MDLTLQCQEHCIALILYYLSGLSRANCSDNLSRNSCICMYFYLKAFQISSHERMLASAKLKESNKGGFDTTVPGTLYCSYPVLPFGIVACKLFRQPFSKQLYLHVFLLKSISDFIPNSHLLHHHHCFHLEKNSIVTKSYTKCRC